MCLLRSMGKIVLIINNSFDIKNVNYRLKRKNFLKLVVCTLIEPK